MFDKIENLFEERFINRENRLTAYDKNDIHIATAITELFEKEKFKKTHYSVESEVVFSSLDCDISYVSVAFIERGELRHTVYVIE
jgi:hypothetical protein